MSSKYPLALLLAVFFLLPLCWNTSADPEGNEPGKVNKVGAIQLAIATLRAELGITGLSESDVKTLHVSRFNWPSSALGCPRPGVDYIETVVSGHLVLLNYAGKRYRVHVGGGQGLVCKLSRASMASADLLLQYLKKLARENLADRLGLDAQHRDKISVIEHEPRVWTNADFDCGYLAQEGGPRNSKVSGYLMLLQYQNQTFEYRSSNTRVAACPPIEAQ